MTVIPFAYTTLDHLSRGDIILLVVALVVSCVVVNLVGEWVCHQGRFWMPDRTPSSTVAPPHVVSERKPYDFERDQRASDAQLTALASTFRALDHRPDLVRSLVDERAARASLGYPNVLPFRRHPKDAA